MITEGAVENWINEEPAIKECLIRIKEIYKGPVRFVRSGRKKYQAKLDCDKLYGFGNVYKEAFFEIDLSHKKENKYVNFFFLRLVSLDRSINTIKLF
jgi:hypothetical protein